MKYLIILILVLSSCGAKYPSRAPKLEEKQEQILEESNLIIEARKHPFKLKATGKIMFWTVTGILMYSLYVMKLN